MANCLIGMGANLQQRASRLQQAAALLDDDPHVSIIRASRNYSTAPIGGPPGQDEYLNAALLAETSLSPQELLSLLKRVEDQLGRERDRRWDARTIDLDLLLYDQAVIRSEELTLPHPRMAFRRFVLAPAVEVAAEMTHPTTGWTVRRLLKHIETGDDYLAIAGIAGVGKTKLADAVAQKITSEQIAVRLVHEPQGNALDPLAALRNRVALLDNAASPEESPPAFVISDFWLEQFMLQARQSLGGQALEAFHRAGDEALTTTLSPKLLVLLDSTVDDPHRQQQSAALCELARRPGRCPLLEIDAGDPQWAVEETAAAILAMRSSPRL